jgi:hypothetical protein
LLVTWAQPGPADLPDPATTLREGDIVFQTSRSAQSRAIQAATHSRFSHVGVVHFQSGRPYVYEAVGPVKLTPLHDWVVRGEGGHFRAMRLKDAEERLTPEALERMRQVGLGFRGRPYDFAFRWTDDELYCSELVWKIYARGLGVELGHLQRLGDFDLGDPVVAAAVRARWGGHVPLDERVVSPGAIAESPLLVVVAEG